jgi:hypothetical protein
MVSIIVIKPASERQTRNKLLGKEDAMFYITGGHFSKRYLIKSILEGKV